jgi:hypothetical protein
LQLFLTSHEWIGSVFGTLPPYRVAISRAGGAL